jgi:hypothetical protein
MFDKKVIDKLKEKYSHLNPLLFHRSKERASSNGELFDILDTVPELPVKWCESAGRWIRVNDVYHREDFAKEF